MFLRLARIVLLVILFAAPLGFGAVQPWAWGLLGAAVAFLLLLWGAACALDKMVRIYWSPIYLPALGFLAIAGVQCCAGLTLDQAATKEALCKLTTDLVLFFLVGQLLAEADKRDWREMGLAITCYSFAMGLFAILQFSCRQNLIHWALRSTSNLFGTYVNRNHYAGLVEMLIPLAVAGAVPTIRRFRSKGGLLVFLALFPITSLLLSGSRGGFVSLTVEALVATTVIFLYAPWRALKTAATTGASLILSAALLFFWIASSQNEEHLAILANATQSIEVTWGDRWSVARDSLRILRDRPWLGSGLGSFETVLPRYQSFPSDLIWDHAHNEYAEALAETGSTGGALVLFTLGLFLWLVFRNLGERLRHSIGWIQFGAALGCCGLLVHSFVDFNLHIPANGAWFAACAALATLRTSPAEADFTGGPGGGRLSLADCA